MSEEFSDDFSEDMSEEISEGIPEDFADDFEVEDYEEDEGGRSFLIWATANFSKIFVSLDHKI